MSTSTNHLPDGPPTPYPSVPHPEPNITASCFLASNDEKMIPPTESSIGIGLMDSSPGQESAAQEFPRQESTKANGNGVGMTQQNTGTTAKQLQFGIMPYVNTTSENAAVELQPMQLHTTSTQRSGSASHRSLTPSGRPMAALPSRTKCPPLLSRLHIPASSTTAHSVDPLSNISHPNVTSGPPPAFHNDTIQQDSTEDVTSRAPESQPHVSNSRDPAMEPILARLLQKVSRIQELSDTMPSQALTYAASQVTRDNNGRRFLVEYMVFLLEASDIVVEVMHKRLASAPQHHPWETFGVDSFPPFLDEMLKGLF